MLHVGGFSIQLDPITMKRKTKKSGGFFFSSPFVPKTLTSILGQRVLRSFSSWILKCYSNSQENFPTSFFVLHNCRSGNRTLEARGEKLSPNSRKSSDIDNVSTYCMCGSFRQNHWGPRLGKMHGQRGFSLCAHLCHLFTCIHMLSRITIAFKSGRIVDSTFRLLSQLWKLKQYIKTCYASGTCLSTHIEFAKL